MATAFDSAAFDPAAFDAAALTLQCSSAVAAAPPQQLASLIAQLRLEATAAQAATTTWSATIRRVIILRIAGADAVAAEQSAVSVVRTKVAKVAAAAAAATAATLAAFRLQRGMLGAAEAVVPLDRAAKLLLKLKLTCSRAPAVIARQAAQINPFMASSDPVFIPARVLFAKSPARARGLKSPARSISP